MCVIFSGTPLCELQKPIAHAMKTPAISRFLASIVLLTIGFFLGRQFSRTPQNQTLRQAVATTSTSSTPVEIAAPITSAPTVSVSPLEKLRALTFTAGPHSRVNLSEAILLIRQLSLAECKTTLPLFQNLNRNEREILSDALAEQWAHLDPVDAFDQAQANRRNNDWSNRIGFAAGAALAATNPQAALDRITNARNNDLREKAAEWVLPALAKIDGHRAADYLTSNSQLTRHEHIYRNVAEQFARSSPREAVAWAETLSSKRLRDDTRVAAWQGWAAVDAPAAALALESHPELKNNGAVLSAIAAHWSHSDIKAVLAWIEADPQARNSAYGSINLESAQLNREDALKLLLTISSSRTRDDFAQKLAVQYARENIQDAFAWAATLPEDKGRSSAMNSILQEWVANNPTAAATHLLTQPESKERTTDLTRVVGLWSQNDPDAADAFVQNFLTGSERDAAMAGLIENISDNQPDKALQLFRSIEDPEISAKLAHRFIGTLVKTDPDTALQIASQLPPESQPDAYRTLVRHWAFDQPEAAGEWINSVPPGEARDSAVKAYVSVIDGMDPALATHWANTIQEPTERFGTTLNAFQRWMQKDMKAARAWAEQTDIPEGVRPFYDRLLNDPKWAKEMDD